MYVCHVELLLSGNHASCRFYQKCMYVMYYNYFLTTMLHAGVFGTVCMMYSMCCYYLKTMLRAGLSAMHACHVVMPLSGDHASCGSCQQCVYVMYYQSLGQDNICSLKW